MISSRKEGPHDGRLLNGSHAKVDQLDLQGAIIFGRQEDVPQAQQALFPCVSNVV